jgi:hypothetical protein
MTALSACRHGSLRRACETCEASDVIASQAEEITRLREFEAKWHEYNAGCADGHEPIRWRTNEDWESCPLCQLREALDQIATKADHCIPPYAYGDNEAACDMSSRLEKIAALAKAAPETKA